MEGNCLSHEPAHAIRNLSSVRLPTLLELEAILLGLFILYGYVQMFFGWF